MAGQRPVRSRPRPKAAGRPLNPVAGRFPRHGRARPIAVPRMELFDPFKGPEGDAIVGIVVWRLCRRRGLRDGLGPRTTSVAEPYCILWIKRFVCRYIVGLVCEPFGAITHRLRCISKPCFGLVFPGFEALHDHGEIIRAPRLTDRGDQIGCLARAILSHAIMEAANDTVPKGMAGTNTIFSDTYFCTQNALALKLAMDLARIFDLLRWAAIRRRNRTKLRSLCWQPSFDGRTFRPVWSRRLRIGCPPPRIWAGSVPLRRGLSERPSKRLRKITVPTTGIGAEGQWPSYSLSPDGWS
jgi:hypothetical protein